MNGLRFLCFFAASLLAWSMVSCQQKTTKVTDLELNELLEEPAPTPLSTAERLLQQASVGGEPAFEAGRYLVQIPESWTEIPPRSPIYLMSFQVPGGVRCDVAVTGGGTENNLKRWVQQMGATWPEAGLAVFEPITLAGAQGYFLRVEGRFSPGNNQPVISKAQLLGAAAEDSQGRVITVKMTGPAAAVAAQQQAFLQFCQSLHLADE